ncbi:protein IWS1 homolog [Enoplosus armatus]|uniref:protein IWS1 homolog n=1 Tax=Enoplosus armatus TaxID=215367 RepID=UPI00399526C2
MDGEEDDFMSGNHSDDGGGTPVQDEHQASGAEEVRSDRHQSEDEGSNDEDAPNAMETSRAASGSDNEDHRGGDSDSEGEAPRGHRDDKSDSETEAPRPANSDDDSPVKRRMSGSDNEEESPIKHVASDNEDGRGLSPPKRRGSSSEGEEREERPRAAADSDSENEDPKPTASPDRRSNADSDSDTETPARRKAAQIDSDEEEEVKPQEEAEGGGGGKWKAVMQSDSEEEEEGRRRKAAAGSDGEQQQQEEKEQRDDSDDEKPVKRKKAILSDSEDEDEEKADKPAKRSRAVSDDENSDSDGGSGGPDKSLAAKLRELGSDSGSEEDERSKAATGKKDEKALFGSDSDSGDGDEEEKMIADIFGESGDEEEEEFTGFNQEDLDGDKKESKEKQQQVEEESDSDDGVDRSGQDTSFMSDFDIMLARRKAMNSKKRRHRDGGTFISDADDVVSAMITKMNEAAEEDRTLNSQKKPALKKLTLLPQVVMHLKKQDLKETFIDSGVMSAIKEWISPLPDKSLPALRIREELLRILQELPSVSQETLKHSGIGRSVMFLYKHPKESRSNKDLALKLINEWSRPIFGLTSNYKGMTREERQQRDLDQQMPQRRRLSSGGQTPRRDLEKQLTGEEKALRPGDPGFCARARVPMPSNKDYVVRPKWNVEMESSRGPMKKGMSRVDKQMRRFADIRRLTKPGHAVKISVEGNRMPL